MNWKFVLFHLIVQLLILVSILFAIRIVQNVFIDRIIAKTGLLEKFAWFTIAKYLPDQLQPIFSMWSFFLWLALTFGSSFVLHLPSMWEKRVQVFAPTKPLDREWYPKLKKPFWNPPNFVFPLLWIPVRILRSAGSSILWETVYRNPAHPIMLIAPLSLALSDIWNQVFFVQHDMAGGILIMTTLSLLEMTYALLLSWHIPPAERFVFLGIFADLFATTLNTSVYLLNRNTTGTKSTTKKAT
mmetsp:Transcript_22176/g.38340  ORF Transcript_22176/g.38340 Transcript_22176/m.38340 type:complete len:242 (-) Transcript_22176:1258-1983(-)